MTDFGIARVLDEEGLTAEGRVLGTTDYVSPEQALGHPVTGQSDIYSLGIVLWEMLTGHVPFEGENQVAVAMKHVRDPLPDVQLERPEVSAALASVVERATAKDLNQRYADISDLAADLEDVLAIETSRSGDVRGEATTVLRTLPEQGPPPAAPAHPPPPPRRAGDRAAGRGDPHRRRAAAHLAHPARGREAGRQAAGQDLAGHARGLGRARLRPLRTGGEHPDETKLAVDNDPGTEWTTESYRGRAGQARRGPLPRRPPGHQGPVHARAHEHARASRLRSTSPTAGRPSSSRGWTKVGAAPKVGAPAGHPRQGRTASTATGCCGSRSSPPGSARRRSRRWPLPLSAAPA